MQLRKLREAHGLNQTEVAEAMGVGQSAVAMWESGTQSPRADKLPMLAKLYNCTIDELFEEGKHDRPA